MDLTKQPINLNHKQNAILKKVLFTELSWQPGHYGLY